ncbi:MAG TPA: hypothetical protein VMC05_05450 [Xanthobacteraceae bacterium]|nr:hypothetical protein [Xanthobacteraceae bacterium]
MLRGPKLRIFFRAVAGAFALALAMAAPHAAQARYHKVRHIRPQTDYLLYDYRYHPILGFTRYQNCYWVEDFAPYRPRLMRVCPPR